MACPLGKLNPFTSSRRGVKGLGRLKYSLSSNIERTLPIATTGTLIEYQRCLRTKRKYAMRIRFAGMRKVCVAKKVTNTIISVFPGVM